ncbi:nucleoside 2-deoxyribosyltransferase [Geomicrobium sp. JCM 19055]|uniref:nucleoside 2-deoxyribosyltransferase n=1 Tax=Geomicrobium sp. JCM 19055 TaxID=1460649 RepID=UPI00045ED779|nr:nucleoside 2-deoxyribosyltransferase [Geomicrobium sp. JCM 19055]GAK00867.1 purine trans deoxyribosylase [Geomicrobium sp. JCM 19055]
MTNVYLASGFFNESQVRKVELAEASLLSKGLNVFSPRENQNQHIEFGSAHWRQATFETDVEAIEWADVLVAIYDEEDAGTMWEIGYAYAIGVPIIVVHKGEEVVNLMITDSLTAYLESFEELLDYDFEAEFLLRKPYTGSVI